MSEWRDFVPALDKKTQVRIARLEGIVECLYPPEFVLCFYRPTVKDVTRWKTFDELPLWVKQVILKAEEVNRLYLGQVNKNSSLYDFATEYAQKHGVPISEAPVEMRTLHKLCLDRTFLPVPESVQDSSPPDPMIEAHFRQIREENDRMEAVTESDKSHPPPVYNEESANSRD